MRTGRPCSRRRSPGSVLGPSTRQLCNLGTQRRIVSDSELPSSRALFYWGEDDRNSAALSGGQHARAVIGLGVVPGGCDWADGHVIRARLGHRHGHGLALLAHCHIPKTEGFGTQRGHWNEIRKFTDAVVARVSDV